HSSTASRPSTSASASPAARRSPTRRPSPETPRGSRSSPSRSHSFAALLHAAVDLAVGLPVTASTARPLLELQLLHRIGARLRRLYGHAREDERFLVLP